MKMWLKFRFMVLEYDGKRLTFVVVKGASAPFFSKWNMYNIEPLKAEIISAFLSGNSCQNISKDFNLGCGPDTVRAYLKKWGIDTSKRYNSERWGVDSARNQEIVTMRQSGKSLQEIANHFGISKERVKQILEKH